MLQNGNANCLLFVKDGIVFDFKLSVFIEFLYSIEKFRTFDIVQQNNENVNVLKIVYVLNKESFLSQNTIVVRFFHSAFITFLLF